MRRGGKERERRRLGSGCELVCGYGRFEVTWGGRKGDAGLTWVFLMKEQL